MAHLEELNPDELTRRAKRCAHYLREGTEGQPTSSNRTNFLEENGHKTGQDFVNAWLVHVFPSNGSSRG
jgi:hypothetical protein